MKKKYLYIAEHYCTYEEVSSSAIKIGVTNNIEARKIALSDTNSPFGVRFKTVYNFAGALIDAYMAEQILHKQYDHFRVSPVVGKTCEWFNDSSKSLEDGIEAFAVGMNAKVVGGDDVKDTTAAKDIKRNTASPEVKERRSRIFELMLGEELNITLKGHEYLIIVNEDGFTETTTGASNNNTSPNRVLMEAQHIVRPGETPQSIGVWNNLCSGYTGLDAKLEELDSKRDEVV